MGGLAADFRMGADWIFFIGATVVERSQAKKLFFTETIIVCE
jgi:hypothetical protein